MDELLWRVSGCLGSTDCFTIELFVVVLADTDIDTPRPKHNGWHFTGNIYKRIFLNEMFCILIIILVNFITNVLIYNDSALVQIMA